MLDKVLTPRQRGLYLAASLLALALAGFFVFAAAQAPPGVEYMRFVKSYMYLTAGASVFAAGVYFVVFWKGVITRRTRQRGWAGVGVVYVGLVGWLIAGTARLVPEMLQDEVRILGLVLMLLAAVAWVRHRVAQAEMNVAEKLLEIELRLAELAESRPQTPGPA